MATLHWAVSDDRIADFCRRWKSREMSVFGSVVRKDLRPDSDIDVLVSFEAGSGWSLLDVVMIQEQLAARLGRSVDLIEEAALRNPRDASSH